MKRDRHRIIEFLVELEKYLKQYEILMTVDQIFELILPLKNGLPSSYYPKDEEVPELPTLSRLVERTNNKGNKSIKTTARILVRVAYNINYKSVIGTNINEVMFKIFQEVGINLIEYTGLILELFYDKNQGKTFLVPEEYPDIDSNCFYEGGYKVFV